MMDWWHLHWAQPLVTDGHLSWLCPWHCQILMSLLLTSACTEFQHGLSSSDNSFLCMCQCHVRISKGPGNLWSLVSSIQGISSTKHGWICAKVSILILCDNCSEHCLHDQPGMTVTYLFCIIRVNTDWITKLQQHTALVNQILIKINNQRNHSPNTTDTSERIQGVQMIVAIFSSLR